MDRVSRIGSSEPIDERTMNFFEDVPAVVLLPNLRWDAKYLWPRGLVATFAPNQPFIRDPFLDSNYGFGCTIYRIKTVCAVPYPPTERLHALLEALRGVDETALNRGGRVGLYVDKGTNYIVVYAGLNKRDADEFETILGESQNQTTETKRHVAQISFRSNVNAQALMINKNKISMESRAYVLGEYAKRAANNRDAIAHAFADQIKTTIESKIEDVVWNVCTVDRLPTWYSDCTPAPTYSNVFVLYGSPLEVVVMQRVAAGHFDVSQQAIPCVWRPGAPLENDARIIGPNTEFVPVDMKPFEHYDVSEKMKLQAIVVRCSLEPYDSDPTNEIEKTFGRP